MTLIRQRRYAIDTLLRYAADAYAADTLVTPLPFSHCTSLPLMARDAA